MNDRSQINDRSRVDALEATLLDRAKTLAKAYVAEGRRTREHMIEEAHEQLRLREERETQNAKALAERLFRQRVQAGEIKLQEELARFQWALVQSAVEQVKERLRQLAEDEPSYLPVLRRLLRRAVEAIEREELVIEVNARDQERLRPHWEEWRQEWVPGKRLILSSTPRECLGGALVRSADERIRVDNTFEGRLERLQEELYRVIMEHLFATVIPPGALPHG
ncbi:V-type ATP synthase subunit E family protein [Methylocaldum sp. 14B]|uniref:V-type ATP synthase subunit E n=1 Tax=Methylocaldum sp. 14B TaxID=1912213 RepID=UPI00098B9000|nr:V-type ATP synthase subunit E family protein [Methylocaldum sp. 14B]